LAVSVTMLVFPRTKEIHRNFEVCNPYITLQMFLSTAAPHLDYSVSFLKVVADVLVVINVRCSMRCKLRDIFVLMKSFKSYSKDKFGKLY
jgi:hypothetical protein